MTRRPLLLFFALVASACGSSQSAQQGGGPAPKIVAAVLPDARPEARVAFEEGLRLYGLGPKHWEGARDKFLEATKKDGKLYEAWHNLGLVEARLGRWDDATGAFERALQIQPASRASAMALAEAFMRDGKPDEAHGLLKKRVAAAPEDLDLRLQYIAALRESRKTAEALEEARAILQKDSRSVRGFNALGMVYLKADRHALAETAFRRALELDGKAAEVWNNLGLVLLERGRDQEAFSAFQKATELDPKYKEALLNKAVVYMDCGDYGKASDELERAAKIDPTDPAVFVALGVAARGTKKLDDAERHYQRALELWPDYPPALYNLGVLYMDFREDKKKARENLLLFRKVAASNDPKRAEAQQRLKELK